MRILSILKTFINLFFITYIVAFGFALFGVLFILTVGDFDSITFTISDGSLTEKIIGTSFIAIVTLLQLASLFFLRKFIYDIIPNNLFSSAQIIWLYKIGKLVIISTIVHWISNFLMKIFFENTIKISVISETTNLYYNSFYMLIIGLFFVFLSKLFRIAKNLKEDNELTI